MTDLIAAARRLAEEPNTHGNEWGMVWCAHCEGNIEWIADHAPDCPWLQMPRIVRALEAAQTVTDGPCPTYWEYVYSGRVNQYGVHEGGNVLRCNHCRRGLHEHATDCPWMAFRNTLAGENVTAE